MRNNQHANAIIAAICLVVSGWALAKSNFKELLQEPERAILQAKPHEKDPLEITEVKVNERVVRLEEKFAENDKWLRHVAFKIRNKYSKPVTYVQINIDFPETEATGTMMQHQVFLGQHPDVKRPFPVPAFRIMPGETAEISLAEEYGEIKRMIELRNPSVDQISRILVRLSDVGFEDGTIYSGGNIFRRNPDANGRPKWLKVNE